jgi:tetratricopeptide (TPR) repeat protein
LQSIDTVSPANFKVAYAFAAIPSRFVLENRYWHEAASLEADSAGFSWKAFPWQQAMIGFTRLLGQVHTGRLDAAKAGLQALISFRDALRKQQDIYKADQVEIQIKAADAWIRLREGKPAEALRLMESAADMEDRTGKHPVTPGELLPARELLADMYAAQAQWQAALAAYEADLKDHPNRFNALYGAGMAAERSGDRQKAGDYYRQLLAIAAPHSDRHELQAARQYLGMH